MLELVTTQAFAEWFSALGDGAAEDVATALEVIAELGPEKAPPGSRESLLWFEHASVTRFGSPRLAVAARFGEAAHAIALDLDESLSWDLEAWGAFRDYASQILKLLESPRFTARLGRLGTREAATVMQAIRRIRRATDPRLRWALKLAGDPGGLAARVRPENSCAEVRALYFEALEAAGFAVTDAPVHSRALREFSRRAPGPAFRLLYGVDVEHKTGLIVLGEWLDRSYYGDSVKRAERLWREFLQGELGALEPLVLR
jgi:hypothetical protein